jgi:hypothetical protein
MDIWLHCLWAYGEAEHEGGEHMTEEVAHHMVARKQKERHEGARVPIFPSRAHPQ